MLSYQIQEAETSSTEQQGGHHTRLSTNALIQLNWSDSIRARIK